MTQRDQLARALRRLDAGESRDAEHVALADRAGGNRLDGCRLHRDPTARDRRPRGLRLRADLDHVGVARIVEVRELVFFHSTVTDLARLRGWSTSVPLPSAT